jgi:hypothetical protein
MRQAKDSILYQTMEWRSKSKTGCLLDARIYNEVPVITAQLCSIQLNARKLERR